MRNLLSKELVARAARDVNANQRSLTAVLLRCTAGVLHGRAFWVEGSSVIRMLEPGALLDSLHVHW